MDTLQIIAAMIVSHDAMADELNARSETLRNSSHNVVKTIAIAHERAAKVLRDRYGIK